MSKLDNFEQQLIEWQKQKSKKCWQEWVHWLRTTGCPIIPHKPGKLDVNEPIPYQNFFNK